MLGEDYRYSSLKRKMPADFLWKCLKKIVSQMKGGDRIKGRDLEAVIFTIGAYAFPTDVQKMLYS